MLAPPEEREEVVRRIERRMSELYDPAMTAMSADAASRMPAQDIENAEAPMLHISTEPVQRAGYIEQVMRSYSPQRDGKVGNGGRRTNESSSEPGARRRTRPAS